MLTKTTLLGAVATLALTLPATAEDLNSVGVTVGNLGNPFFVQVVKGVEAKARELGGDDVQVTAVAVTALWTSAE